jgi:dolichyl-phosphate beta-glucosyltransferase
MVDLSVVVPLYNEIGRLGRCMTALVNQLSVNLVNYEIILVSNGCTDGTIGLAEWYAGINPRVRALSIPERGKGAAVRSGMLAARGRLVYMCDVDLSTPVKEIARFSELMSYGFDVVIGSREVRRELVQATVKRRLIGRAFHLLTAVLVPGVQDTQCGFKMFTRQAARAIFAECKIDGLAFDVEALHLAQRMGYTIYEMPVQWEHDADSRVRLVGDSAQMLKDVGRIPFLHSGKEYEKSPA